MRCRTGASDKRGSVTAEFAAVIPAVVLLLACALACVQLAAQQVLVQDAAADAARSLARGDPPGTVASRVAHSVPGARLSSSTQGDQLCARLTARSRSPMGTLVGLTLSARSCALAGGL